MNKFLLSGILLILVSGNALGIDGTVESIQPGNVLILSRSMQPHIVALTNWPWATNAAYGREIHCSATRVGIYRYGDMPLELYGYSTNSPTYRPRSLAPFSEIRKGQITLTNLLKTEKDIDSQIAKYVPSASTNAFASNAVATLNAQKITIELKIQKQREIVKRLEE